MTETIKDILLRALYTIIECALAIIVTTGSATDWRQMIVACLVAGVVTILRASLHYLSRYAGGGDFED